MSVGKMLLTFRVKGFAVWLCYGFFGSPVCSDNPIERIIVILLGSSYSPVIPLLQGGGSS